jgi:hypothetical protein
MFCSNYSHGLNLSLEIPPQKCNGGEGGIRTHGTVTRTTVFETAQLIRVQVLS